MRRLSVLAVLLLSLTSAYARHDKVTKDMNVLPASSRQFLTEHFANIPVAHIQVEKNLMVFTDEYEVILTDGTNVEFNRQGEWKDVKRHNQAIPAAIVPAQIQKYVKQNYPATTIVSISKDRKDYEVDLSNKIELKFDLKGRLIEID